MAELYIVATPIGNLEDITHRAVRVLSEASLILAEDTRVTRHLLSHYGITTRCSSWHQHSDEQVFASVKPYFDQGKSVAYVSDAGTPGISDPGGKLIELTSEQCPDVQIVPIPGASALAAAVSIAGIPMDEFHFMGFLPHKKGRQTGIRKIAASTAPVVLFESVHRIRKLLTELAGLEKQVIVCRELTKKFETVYRGTPEEVLLRLKPAEEKGEFVVIIHSHGR
jgi:16S rRNA (cytidine1402-2'-O)-methyltransferase